jgi:hypothetical protein
MLFSARRFTEAAEHFMRAADLLNSGESNSDGSGARLRCLAQALSLASTGERQRAIQCVTDFLIQTADHSWNAYKMMSMVLRAIGDDVAYQHCAHGCMQFALGEQWCTLPSGNKVSVTEAVRERMAEVRVYAVSEETPFDIPQSRALDDARPERFAQTRIDRAPAPTVATLKSAFAVASRFGTAVFARDGRYVGDLSTGDTRLLAVSRPMRNSRHVPNPVFLALEPWGDEFFHWMFDVLPKFAFLPERDDYLIALKGSRGYQEAHLRMLGIPPARILPVEDDDVIASNEVLVVAGARTPYDRYEIRPWVVRYLRSSFIAHASDRNDLPSRFLIVRRGGNGREIANLGDLQRALVPAGFVPVVLDELSVPDQIRLFSKAEAIVAIAGAGLANLVFAPPAARVLIFYPRSVEWQIYWRICGFLGLTHYHASATSIAPVVTKDPDWMDICNNRSMRIDVHAAQRFAELIS